jgi:hypothetical protein
LLIAEHQQIPVGHRELRKDNGRVALWYLDRRADIVGDNANRPQESPPDQGSRRLTLVVACERDDDRAPVRVPVAAPAMAGQPECPRSDRDQPGIVRGGSADRPAQRGLSGRGVVDAHDDAPRGANGRGAARHCCLSISSCVCPRRERRRHGASVPDPRTARAARSAGALSPCGATLPTDMSGIPEPDASAAALAPAGMT